MRRIHGIMILLLIVSPALAENDTHAVHLEIFCNSTGHVQLISIDGGEYQNCASGNCWIAVPNTTTRWIPHNETEAAEIAREVVSELHKYPNYKPLSEERIKSISVNSSTYVKDSGIEWATKTLMPNIQTLDSAKDDLRNCTTKLREAEMSRQNIIDMHKPEIESYTERIAGLESDTWWYQVFIIGGISVCVLFLLKERGILAGNLFDRVKRRKH